MKTAVLILGIVEIFIGAIITLRNIIFFFYEKKGLKPQLIVLLGFETAMLLSGILTFNGWSCIFMIMSSMLGTYCLWQNNMTVLRVANVVCSLLLITNYICTGLYTTIIAQTIILTSIIVSIVRLDILPRRNNTMVKEQMTGVPLIKKT